MQRFQRGQSLSQRLNPPYVADQSSTIHPATERRQAMKKRGLKRYYRHLSKLDFANRIVIGMRNGKVEYDYEHIHLDGYTLTKWAEIKSHLDVLFNQFDIFRLNSKSISLPFQVWGYVCFQHDYGCQIALYLHTPNNDFDDFPMLFTNASESRTLRWKELSDYLDAKIAIGYEVRYSNNCDGEPEIFIAARNVVLPIFIESK